MLFNTKPIDPMAYQLAQLQNKQKLIQGSLVAGNNSINTGGGLAIGLLANILAKRPLDQIQSGYDEINQQKQKQAEANQALLAQAMKTNDFSILSKSTDPMHQKVFMESIKNKMNPKGLPALAKTHAYIDSLKKQRAQILANKGDTSEIDKRIKQAENAAQGRSKNPTGGAIIQNNLGKGEPNKGFKMTKQAQNTNQVAFFKIQDALQLAKLAQSRFNKKFSSGVSQAGFAIDAFRDKWLSGVPLAQLKPKNKEELAAFTKWRRDTNELLGRILNAISGVAVSDKEAERTQKWVPNDGDSGIEYEAKIQGLITSFTLMQLRRAWAAKHARTSGRSIEALEKDLPLNIVENFVRKNDPDVYRQITGGKALGTAEQAYNRALSKGKTKGASSKKSHTKKYPMSAWTKAKNSVRVGEQYVGPDGATYVRSK